MVDREKQDNVGQWCPCTPIAGLYYSVHRFPSTVQREASDCGSPLGAACVE